MLRRRIGTGLLVALVCGAVLRAAPSITAPKPAPAGAKTAGKPDPRTVAALMHQGEEALAAEDYHAARDAFVDVISLDSANLRAQEGASLAAFPVAADLLVTAAAVVPAGSKIEVQNADGAAFDAEVVRSDPDSGLALLRVSGAKLSYLTLAEGFSGRTISCVSFPVPNLFQPTAETIGGSATGPKSPWTIRLNRSPRLGGGPLLSGGRVVGVELATRDSDIGAVPAASLEELKKLLGSDLPAGGGASDGAGVTMQLSAVLEK